MSDDARIFEGNIDRESRLASEREVQDALADHDHGDDAPPAGGPDDILTSRAVDEAMQRGELTTQQAAELLQQAERRRAAEEGPSSDTNADGIITQGGFGSGQGMQKQRTGQ